MKVEIKLYKTSAIYLAIPVLVSLIALLLCACTSTGKNETTSINSVTSQVANKVESDNSKTEGDLEVVCRTRLLTGSTFKKKTCATKAEWARRDKKKREEVERMARDIDDKTNLNQGTGNPMGAGATVGSMPGM